jgi:hypothetical protein
MTIRGASIIISQARAYEAGIYLWLVSSAGNDCKIAEGRSDARPNEADAKPRGGQVEAASPVGREKALPGGAVAVPDAPSAASSAISPKRSEPGASSSRTERRGSTAAFRGFPSETPDPRVPIARPPESAPFTRPPAELAISPWDSRLSLPPTLPPALPSPPPSLPLGRHTSLRASRGGAYVESTPPFHPRVSPRHFSGFSGQWSGVVS